MTTVASQITSLTIVYSIVYSGADQRKLQSSASLAFVRGIHRDRWISRTKGQLRGKRFHLMTSSWFLISQLWCGCNCSPPVFVKKTGGGGVVTFLSISFLVISNLETSHYSGVIMSTMTSQITSVFTVCSVFCSGADQRKHQNSASLAYVGGIHRGPVNPHHKGSVTQKMFHLMTSPGTGEFSSHGPVTRKIFPFDDVIMIPETHFTKRLWACNPIVMIHVALTS